MITIISLRNAMCKTYYKKIRYNKTVTWQKNMQYSGAFYI